MAVQLSLAVLLALGPIAVPDTAYAGGSCASSATWSTPPDHIDVFRIHHKGSSLPARVERWSFKRYVAAVMSSGAWPNRVWQSAKVGALAIEQYAWWQAIHTCRSWHGHPYSITDSEQFLRRDVRPGSHVPVRTLAAVRSIWGVHLTKHGRAIRTGWSGGRVHDGWHLGEDSVREAALRGWGWRHILRHYLSPVRIIEGGA